ncbi:MAG: DUF1501 domain-containing protein [Polyangiaceae bacterium]
MSQFRLSRRSLLFAAGLAPAVLCVPSIALAADARPPTLVCVFLRGGLDGLSAVVPFADDDYRRARKSVAIAAPDARKDAAVALNDRFALHPALSPLVDAWKARHLAVVHAVGSPHPTRSHFEAQDHFEWGALTATDGHGWLARAATKLSDASSLSRIALSRATPLSFRGDPSVVSAPGLEQVGLQAPPRLRDRLESAFGRVYSSATTPAARAGRDALKVARQLRELPSFESAAKYPQGAKGLADVARLIRADVGLRLAWVDSTGWDTHTGQSARLNRNLDALGRALSAFRDDLGDHLQHTIVLVMTEFGRTVKENGTGGTDHGHGSVMLAMGGTVDGGKVHGNWPGLSSEALYEGRDLAVTTDYRDVFHEVLSRHMRVDGSAALGGYAPARAVGVVRG